LPHLKRLPSHVANGDKARQRCFGSFETEKLTSLIATILTKKLEFYTTLQIFLFRDHPLMMLRNVGSLLTSLRAFLGISTVITSFMDDPSFVNSHVIERLADEGSLR
jgi:hypothetical protein